MVDERAFLDWVVEIADRYQLSLVMPMTDRTLVPIASDPSLPATIRSACPELAALRQVTDKATTFAIAERLGVAIPASVAVDSGSDLAELGSAMRFPVVLKPAQSVTTAADGTRTAHTVSYAQSETQFLKKAQAVLVHTPFVLQEHFQGLGVGVEVLARDGEMLYAFQHRRLHEVPLTGGGSSLRMSEDVAPVLAEASEKLIRELRWTGVAMVEFKWRPETREYRLMEINGRFWGSLPLAVAAGADFPAMLANMLLEDQSTGFGDYRRGVYCRHLARDVMWHELVLRSTSSELARVPDRREVLADLRLVLSPRHHFDIQNLRDPLPGLFDAWTIINAYLRRGAGVVAERWFTVSQRLLWHNGTVATRLRDAGSVLFLCYGNINRSAAAELLLRGAPGSERLEIHSAGFHPEDGRPVDPNMAAILREQGMNSDAASSTTLSEALLARSDVIFVMEKDHHDRVAALSPDAAKRTFLLGGQLADNRAPGGAIADPYNRSEADYRQCFDAIRDAVQQLTAMLRA